LAGRTIKLRNKEKVRSAVKNLVIPFKPFTSTKCFKKIIYYQLEKLQEERKPLSDEQGKIQNKELTLKGYLLSTFGS